MILPAAVLSDTVKNCKISMSLINAKNWVADALNAQLSEHMWDGSTLVAINRDEKREHGTALRILPTMTPKKAVARAPDTYAELENASTGEMLLALIERNLQRILGPEAFATQWPKELSAYENLAPRRLQLLARRVMNLQLNYPQEMASLSIIAYALLGYADLREINNLEKYGAECELCYRTAMWPSKYCERDQASKENRRRGTKKRGASENLEVSRRRARRICEIALMLRRSEQSLYGRLHWQLLGIAGGLNPLPPPLEELHDDEFATGARIGPNGGRWFIYLWEVLPRVRKVLGTDWVDRVLSAMDDGEWCFVISRLQKIDPSKESTDAHKWAMTLIDAEEWLEAEDIERRQRRRPGRPPRDPSDPRINGALVQLDDGNPIKDIACSAGVSVSTVYRWKAITTSP